MKIGKHHKWIIGSFTTLVVIFMILISIFTYSIYTSQEMNYNKLNKKVSLIQKNIQSQINLLSSEVEKTKSELQKNKQEFKTLKSKTGEDFSEIYSKAVKSVVILSTDISQGTGFIIHENGYVVTNYHIIRGATMASIYTIGDGPYNVTLIGTDPDMDLALLKIGGEFKKIELANSNDTLIGENVLAIGNPYGLQFSATIGSVSQLNRRGPNNKEAYVQIDASINPGNSGGPLINKEGKVIGIVNFKLGGGAEGLGFALESNYIKEFVNKISMQKLNATLID